MNYNFTISQPILVTGQLFRYRYRDLPSGTFTAYATTSTQVIALTGLTPNTQYEMEIEFFNGGDFCAVTTVIFDAANNVACPTFSGVIMSNGIGFYLRVSWSGVVGYPIGGYQIFWQQGAANGSISYPTALPVAGYVDIPLPSSADTDLNVYSNNGFELKICTETPVTYSEPCTPMVVSDVSINQDVNGSLVWIITIFFTQSTPATLTTGITYVQTDGSAAASFSAFLSPTATSYSFSVSVVSYTGVRPDFNGTITDRCGNSHAWSI